MQNRQIVFFLRLLFFLSFFVCCFFWQYITFYCVYFCKYSSSIKNLFHFFYLKLLKVCEYVYFRTSRSFSYRFFCSCLFSYAGLFYSLSSLSHRNIIKECVARDAEARRAEALREEMANTAASDETPVSIYVKHPSKFNFPLYNIYLNCKSSLNFFFVEFKNVYIARKRSSSTKEVWKACSNGNRK